MGGFTEALQAVLSRLAEWLGIKPSSARRLELMQQKLAGAKAANVDRLEQLKDEIRKLEARAVQQKRDYDEARGARKRVIAGEIERTFRELDRLQGPEGITASNIEKISIAQGKIRELTAALTQGVEEEQLDEIAVEIQEAFAELKSTDAAVRDLERERYEAPEVARVDVEERVARVEGREKEEAELSKETLERLKQIEAEEA